MTDFPDPERDLDELVRARLAGPAAGLSFDEFVTDELGYDLADFDGSRRPEESVASAPRVNPPNVL